MRQQLLVGVDVGCRKHAVAIGGTSGRDTEVRLELYVF